MWSRGTTKKFVLVLPTFKFVPAPLFVISDGMAK